MQRLIEKTLIERLKEDRAVALLGPRQSGKSFLLRNVIKNYGGNYINLDDPALREEIVRGPIAYLKRNYSPGKFMFIDEAAKVPAIFDAIKIIIDEQESKPSGICLANSGNYLLMRRIKETLA